MLAINHRAPHESAVGFDHALLFASLELSGAKWLITSAAPGVEKFSKHQVKGGDGPALLAVLREQRARAARRTGAPVDVVVIQEAGNAILDSPSAGKRRDRKSCGRSGLDRGEPAGAPRQDRRDRRRDAGADLDSCCGAAGATRIDVPLVRRVQRVPLGCWSLL